MIFFSRKLFALVMSIAVFSGLLYTAHAGIGDITLQIQGVGLRHGTPDNVNLGVMNTSITDQEISGQFSDYFWVEDLQGYITGHYTTIQCDGVYGPNGYRLTGVYLKAGDTNPTLIEGLVGNVYIATGFHDYANILSPMTYIYKPTDVSNNGIANKYGDRPRLKIIIPGYTPPGTYSGTIIFSFYMY